VFVELQEVEAISLGSEALIHLQLGTDGFRWDGRLCLEIGVSIAAPLESLSAASRS